MRDKCGTSPIRCSRATVPLPLPERLTDQKVCFVSTITWSLKFHLSPHIRKISEKCRVTLVADEVSSMDLDVFGPIVAIKSIPIKRRISMLSDIATLFELWLFFMCEGFSCIHSIAPKAGLLAMLAATLASVPVRFHTFTGQVWVTRTGLSRLFLMGMDWLIAQCATQILTDSLSQRDFLIANRIVKPDKITVLGIGSVVGVDTLRFAPNKSAREQVRINFGIGDSALVYIYVGRLNSEKGVSDLLQAFEIVSDQFLEAHLLLVGPDE
ncbi:MAG: glycosyltransferase, partial [Gallionella sp.]